MKNMNKAIEVNYKVFFEGKKRARKVNDLIEYKEGKKTAKEQVELYMKRITREWKKPCDLLDRKVERVEFVSYEVVTW